MTNQTSYQQQSWNKAVLLAALQCLTVYSRELSSSYGAAGTPSDKCCIVYRKSHFTGSSESYCLSDEQMQDSYDLIQNNQGNNWGVGSVKCGPLVEATVCPHGTTQVAIGPDNRYQCDGGDLGEQVGSREFHHSVPLEWNHSTLILEQHPWVAKGEQYLSYDRQKKARIIRDKVNASQEQGTLNSSNFLKIDLKEAFDTWGDEFDCRYKTTHGQGNVGEIEWVSIGDHQYTGLFEGADTGFIRTSDLGAVNTNPQEGQRWMLPSIAIKLLRDGMDSGNTQSQIQGRNGQFSYNWFERPLASFIKGSPSDSNDPVSVPASTAIAIQVTDFVGSVGFSEFARYDQLGKEVSGDPKFPFELEYRPTGQFKFPSETYDRTIFEYLAEDIPVDSILYHVYARDKPEKLGGEWAHIADIKLKSQLLTSYWGDTKMHFRHQRHDDDFVYEPTWAPFADPFVPSVLGRDEYQLRPQQAKIERQCPFSWILENLY